MEKSLSRIENYVVQALALGNDCYSSRKRPFIDIEDNTDRKAEEVADVITNTSSIGSQHNSIGSANATITNESSKLKQTPHYKVETLSGLCIEQVIKDWYLYHLYSGRFTKDSNTGNVRRIVRVFNFVKKCLSKYDIECLNSNRPSINDPSYMLRTTNFNATASTAKLNVMFFFKEYWKWFYPVTSNYFREAKKTTSSSFVTSILHRVDNLKKIGIDVMTINYPFNPKSGKN